ncbi:hypothetical protein [Paenibacillus sp. sgz500992]|uniref:hypothetical protein n=1 Tax=Paenibacillus sp. sgz500992 TaxID=3242476 RepID=UPI0036D2C764
MTNRIETINDYVDRFWVKVLNAYSGFTNLDENGKPYYSNYNDRYRQSSIAYLTEAFTLIEHADSFYRSDFKQGELPAFEDIVHEFYLFNTSFLNEFNTNTTGQIYIEPLIEAYNEYSKYKS